MERESRQQIDNHRKTSDALRSDVFIYDPVGNLFYTIKEDEDPLGLMVEMGSLMEEGGGINKLTIVDSKQREKIEQKGYE